MPVARKSAPYAAPVLGGWLALVDALPGLVGDLGRRPALGGWVALVDGLR